MLFAQYIAGSLHHYKREKTDFSFRNICTCLYTILKRPTCLLKPALENCLKKKNKQQNLWKCNKNKKDSGVEVHDSKIFGKDKVIYSENPV